ncbi:hypothetical protein B296_00011220 [Ensete ventricosum]|uniref:TypA/BipA C-terminal domain-containing protein n=1 Tax=Ensete ventricosum TaxID=4639 RepID=A0A427AK66_ENSVE|nr:hypothetical protein B296_00011220 [Ensete ventricosum]
MLPQVSNTEYDEHKGKIAIGRLHAGVLQKGTEVKVRTVQLFEQVQAGDICAVCGINDIMVSITAFSLHRSTKELYFHSADENANILYYFVQIATVELPEEYMGPVVELLGRRRGQMFDMQGVGSPFLLYAVVLDSPLNYSLDDCIEYIQEDELVEVTPLSIRMCKNPKLYKKR